MTFLSLKNDVNVASKSNKQKKTFLVVILKVSDEGVGSRVWSRLVRGTDQGIRIRIKMSRIRNTANKCFRIEDHL
jgi:hypothetical protein